MRTSYRSVAPVFICGTARSGTTLLLELLDSHPALAVLPGETYFYRSLFERPAVNALLHSLELLDQRRLIPLLGRFPATVVAFSGRAAVKQLLRQWVGYFPTGTGPTDALIDQALDRHYVRGHFWGCFLDLFEQLSGQRLSDKTWWVEKTPSNERFVGLSEAEFAKTCRYVHVIRDPRDVVASWLTRHLVSDHWDRARWIVRGCYAWSRGVQACVENRRACQGRYHVIRYEDLVAETQTVMSQVSDALDIEADESLLRPTSLNVALPINSSYPDARPEVGRVIATQVHRFRTTLSAPEISFVECTLAAQMGASGYDAVGADGTHANPLAEPRDVTSKILMIKMRRTQHAFATAPLYSEGVGATVR